MTEEEKALRRLQSPKVHYMELRERAGAFSCGNCRFASPSEEFCTNQLVWAPVSALHGCCNLFFPVNDEPLPPTMWEAFR